MSEIAEEPGSRLSFECHLWRLRRQDGAVLGFTDHDRDLELDGLIYRASAGLSARALQTATGLSVDNSEAIGALSDAALRAEDLRAGRYDGAEVLIYRVDWRALAPKELLFRGHLGEVAVQGAGFRCELRGLSEALSLDQGRVYSRQCGAVLGDPQCAFDLSQPGYAVEHRVEAIDRFGRVLHFDDLQAPAPGWFQGGKLSLTSGEGAGLWQMVKSDRFEGARRRIELWSMLRAPVMPGDRLTLTAGCDKSAQTCRLKFGNFINFRGFPHLPGEDWITAYPRDGVVADGGSLFKPVQYD